MLHVIRPTNHGEKDSLQAIQRMEPAILNIVQFNHDSVEMTARDVGEILGISDRTVRQWAQSYPSIVSKRRDGKKVLYSLSDLKRLKDALRITRKDKPTLRLYVPRNFDFKAHLPPHLWKHIDRLMYLVDVVATKSILRGFDSRNGTSEFNREVRLMGLVNRKIVGATKYQEILHAAEVAGILEVNRKRRPGQAYAFKLGPAIRYLPFEFVAVTDRHLCKHLHGDALLPSFDQSCPTLSKVMNSLKRIKLNAAEAYRCLDGLDLPPHKRLISEHRINLLEEGRLFVTRGRTGRVYHNVATLKRETRAALSVDGANLVELDIANAQPLLLTYAYLAWKSSEDATSLWSWWKSIGGRHPTEKRGAREIKRSKVLLCKISSNIADVKSAYDLLRICQNGEFYAYLAPHAGLGINPDQIAQLKEKILSSLFFAPTEYAGSNIVEGFKACFPDVYEMIEASRVIDESGKPKSGLASMLQQLESAVVIETALSDLQNQLVNEVFLPIHDSIMCTPRNAPTVKSKLEEVFADMGLSAIVRIKDYNKPNHLHDQNDTANRSTPTEAIPFRFDEAGVQQDKTFNPFSSPEAIYHMHLANSFPPNSNPQQQIRERTPDESGRRQTHLRDVKYPAADSHQNTAGCTDV